MTSAIPSSRHNAPPSIRAQALRQRCRARIGGRSAARSADGRGHQSNHPSRPHHHPLRRHQPTHHQNPTPQHSRPTIRLRHRQPLSHNNPRHSSHHAHLLPRRRHQRLPPNPNQPPQPNNDIRPRCAGPYPPANPGHRHNRLYMGRPKQPHQRNPTRQTHARAGLYGRKPAPRLHSPSCRPNDICHQLPVQFRQTTHLRNKT